MCCSNTQNFIVLVASTYPIVIKQIDTGICHNNTHIFTFTLAYTLNILSQLMLLCIIAIVGHSRTERMLQLQSRSLPCWQWAPSIFLCVCYESFCLSCHFIVTSSLLRHCRTSLFKLSARRSCTLHRYEIWVLHSPFYTKIMEVSDDCVLVWIS